MEKSWDLDELAYSRGTVLFPSVGCPETSLRNHHYSFRGGPEECTLERPDCGPHRQGRR